jgi:hypothetical protein
MNLAARLVDSVTEIGLIVYQETSANRADECRETTHCSRVGNAKSDVGAIRIVVPRTTIMEPSRLVA